MPETKAASNTPMAPIAVDKLRIGSALPRALFNQDGVLLLASGVKITAQFLHLLRQRGIYEVLIDQGAPASKPQASIEPKRLVRDLDAMLRDTASEAVPRYPRDKQRARLNFRQLQAETERGRECFTESVFQTADLMTDLSNQRCKNASIGRQMIRTFFDMGQLDPSLLPTVIKLQDKHNEYLFEHSVNVALLAMTVSSELGLPSEQTIEVGIGALLQDVGMLNVPEDLRLAPRWLNGQEREEIERHPFYTLRSLQEVNGLSETSVMIAYQAHERNDGSGYPRKHEIRHTHFIARLVAIADVYAALCSSRPQRNAYSPYEAMMILLDEGKRGKLDRHVLRFFIDAMSLFPISSYVRLSDGTAARVIRANPGQHTRPVVIPVDENAKPGEAEIDLSIVTDLFVLQALRDENDLVLDFSANA